MVPEPQRININAPEGTEIGDNIFYLLKKSTKKMKTEWGQVLVEYSGIS